MYKLAVDGDSLEKFCWDKFIWTEFPSYEKFWQEFVVPLTNRPKDIHFKTDNELASISKGHQDICIAQLHYSVLRHLLRAYMFINSSQVFRLDELTDGMARLCSALDVADELLERFNSSNEYNPWCEKDGKNARHKWRNKMGNQLQKLRDYRNHLIHGRLTPSINGLLLPIIGKETDYLDWRRVTDLAQQRSLNPQDFLPPKEILVRAWQESLSYLEGMWQNHLLKS